MHTKFCLANLKGSSEHRWEDNIRMDLRGKRVRNSNLIYLAQDMSQWRAILNTVVKLRIPQKAGIFLIS
jgi:hypothetical protein